MLPRGEVAQSLTCTRLEVINGGALLVGTGLVKEADMEPERGRILTFGISSERRLQLLNQCPTPGCVYSLEMVKEKLVAAVNGMVQRMIVVLNLLDYLVPMFAQ